MFLFLGQFVKIEHFSYVKLRLWCTSHYYIKSVYILYKSLVNVAFVPSKGQLNSKHIGFISKIMSSLD